MYVSKLRVYIQTTHKEIRLLINGRLSKMKRVNSVVVKGFKIGIKNFASLQIGVQIRQSCWTILAA